MEGGIRTEVYFLPPVPTTGKNAIFLSEVLDAFFLKEGPPIMDAIVRGRKALRINITHVNSSTDKGSYTQMLNMNLANSNPAQTISVPCGYYNGNTQ